MTPREQFYETINQVLPTIQEGLIITKDYAFDLFDRYITYLIVTDSIALVGMFIITIITFIVSISLFKQYKEKEDSDGYNDNEHIIFFSIAGFIITGLFILLTFTAGNNLFKSIFVPEVRIYEIHTNK